MYVRANQPSSSSRRERAGKGAPGASFSYSGSLIPPCPNGFNDCNFPSIGVELVLAAGTAGSRRLQPKLFIESLKDEDAMTTALCVRRMKVGGSRRSIMRLC